ncbi:TIGR02444 family protein [Pseudomonas oryzae]|uniref:TIGR02444 family protein n=1 Tax=Pseudomonas oryzae TaxID=1392877 RepID=A0A1H1X6X0_9PSED|nr:TIGR02444 family protein [Pseudomonas oryzae]SDT05037.1 TIGR02444 family protein [Pseudomonas oryzae]
MAQSLWDFSITLYSRPGIAELCLQLQDARDADVCLLLTALWLERRGVAATPARLARLEQLAQPWQQAVTIPLRQLRRTWKAAASRDAGLAELRRELAALELKAERLLLERLQELASDWPPANGAAPSDWLETLAAGWAAATTDHRAALQALRDAAMAATQP